MKRLVLTTSLYLLPILLFAQWTQLIGPVSSNEAISIDVSGDGGVYVAGKLQQYLDFGDTTITVTWPLLGTSNGFVVKYDSLGNLEWVRTFTGQLYLADIAVDRAGSVYIAGSFSDTMLVGADTIVAASAFLSSKPFLTKFDKDGNYRWTQTPVMNFVDFFTDVYEVEIDSSGDIYYTGTNPPFQSDTMVFGSDTLYAEFLAKYDSAGNCLKGIAWFTTHLAFDTAGYYYTTDGLVLQKFDYTNSLVFQSSINNPAVDMDVDGLGNIYILTQNNLIEKYDDQGSFLWDVAIDAVEVRAIDCDTAGNSVVIYEDATYVYPTTVRNFDASGNNLGVTFLGTSQDNSSSASGRDIKVVKGKAIYVIGETWTGTGAIFIDDTLIGHILSTDIFTCKFDTSKLFPSGIKTNTSKHCPLKLYPNPTSGEVRIKNVEFPITNVEVFDIFGRPVKVDFDIQRSTFNIQHSPPGIYFVRVGDKVQKVVLSR